MDLSVHEFASLQKRHFPQGGDGGGGGVGDQKALTNDRGGQGQDDLPVAAWQKHQLLC